MNCAWIAGIEARAPDSACISNSCMVECFYKLSRPQTAAKVSPVVAGKIPQHDRGIKRPLNSYSGNFAVCSVSVEGFHAYDLKQ